MCTKQRFFTYNNKLYLCVMHCLLLYVVCVLLFGIKYVQYSIVCFMLNNNTLFWNVCSLTCNG